MSRLQVVRSSVGSESFKAFKALLSGWRLAERTLGFEKQVALITLLPKKKQDIERPIALIPISQKILLNAAGIWRRRGCKKHCPGCGGTAVPGTSTLDIALKRLMSYESSKVRGSYRVSLFLDLFPSVSR